MGKKKSNINWYLITLGILSLYFCFRQISNPVGTPNTRTITVELSSDIQIIIARGKTAHFKFWTEEYDNQFNIVKGGFDFSKKDPTENLKKGQKVQVTISELDFRKLANSGSDVTVRGISIEGNVVLTTSEFNQLRKRYKSRKMVFAVFMGIMFLLNGFFDISSKYNYGLIGIFLITLLTMKIMGFGLYG